MTLGLAEIARAAQLADAEAARRVVLAMVRVALAAFPFYRAFFLPYFLPRSSAFPRLPVPPGSFTALVLLHVTRS